MTLSRHAPLPSMLMAIFSLSSTPVKAMLVNWADSTGRRNTVFVDVCQALVKRLSGGLPAQRLTGASIEGGCHSSKRLGIMRAEIRPLVSTPVRF
jgi:hypothetical protein